MCEHAVGLETHNWPQHQFVQPANGVKLHQIVKVANEMVPRKARKIDGRSVNVEIAPSRVQIEGEGTRRLAGQALPGRFKKTDEDIGFPAADIDNR